MHLVFDIFQGIGVAAAVGMRPFLPALVTGGLAAGDVELSFHHTHFLFLQQPIFLIVMFVAAVVFAVADWRSAGSDGATRALTGMLAVVALVIGALLCGGAIAHSHHASWIGIVAGVVCAAIGIVATRPLLHRVRARLDADSRGLLPVLVELAAALAAALSVVAPPIGVILVAALMWLLVVGRGREQTKYAGLRILR